MLNLGAEHQTLARGELLCAGPDANLHLALQQLDGDGPWSFVLTQATAVLERDHRDAHRPVFDQGARRVRALAACLLQDGRSLLIEIEEEGRPR